MHGSCINKIVCDNVIWFVWKIKDYIGQNTTGLLAVCSYGVNETTCSGLLGGHHQVYRCNQSTFAETQVDRVRKMSEKVPYLSARLYQNVFCVVGQKPQGHSLSH